PPDRIGFRLLVLVPPELVDPADLAVLSRQADERIVVRQNEDKLAGDPGAVAARDFLLPDALAVAQVYCRHAAAMTYGEDPPMVDDRPAANIGKPRDRIDAARRSEAVRPDGAAVLDP